MPDMINLLLATRNAHKVDEIRAILGNEFRYQTMDQWPGAPDLIEDADSFKGNATKKAVQLARWISMTGRPGNSPSLDIPFAGETFVLADDSGLEVDALNGAPGIHSARFAAADAGLGQNSSPAENNAKLLRLLEGVPITERTARFRCVIAITQVIWRRIENASPVCFADEEELSAELFEGTCEGRIGFAPCGLKGFGYDPLFIPLGYSQTFAELGALDEDVKNQLSHRAKALANLKKRFFTIRSEPPAPAG